MTDRMTADRLGTIDLQTLGKCRCDRPDVQIHACAAPAQLHGRLWLACCGSCGLAAPFLTFDTGAEQVNREAARVWSALTPAAGDRFREIGAQLREGDWNLRAPQELADTVSQLADLTAALAAPAPPPADAVRALVEKWREMAAYRYARARAPLAAKSDAMHRLTAADLLTQCADELEAALTPPASEAWSVRLTVAESALSPVTLLSAPASAPAGEEYAGFVHDLNAYADRVAKHDAAAAHHMRTAAELIARLSAAPAAVDGWTDKPTVRGWYWHDDGDVMRVQFVFERPGHSYLAIEDEANSVSGKRAFRMADRIGGKWLRIAEPKTAALTGTAGGDKTEDRLTREQRAAFDALKPGTAGAKGVG